jgi:hypothetical protein
VEIIANGKWLYTCKLTCVADTAGFCRHFFITFYGFFLLHPPCLLFTSSNSPPDSPSFRRPESHPISLLKSGSQQPSPNLSQSYINMYIAYALLFLILQPFP